MSDTSASDKTKTRVSNWAWRWLLQQQQQQLRTSLSVSSPLLLLNRKNLKKYIFVLWWSGGVCLLWFSMMREIIFCWGKTNEENVDKNGRDGGKPENPLTNAKDNETKNGCFQEVTMPEGLKFPVESIQAFDEMEANLIDPGMRSGLVNVLADLGGRTFDECTRRTIQFVIDNQLSLIMNMFGRNGKKAFGNSNLFEAVYRAVKRNFTESTKKDADKSVAKWLIGSRDRQKMSHNSDFN